MCANQLVSESLSVSSWFQSSHIQIWFLVVSADDTVTDVIEEVEKTTKTSSEKLPRNSWKSHSKQGADRYLVINTNYFSLKFYNLLKWNYNLNFTQSFFDTNFIWFVSW